MENKKQLTIGVIITLLLATSGTYFLTKDDNAYYCQSKDIVMICEKLSDGIGTRCYYEDTYKVCNEGWKNIEIGQELKPNYARKYLCSPVECIEIKS